MLYIKVSLTAAGEDRTHTINHRKRTMFNVQCSYRCNLPGCESFSGSSCSGRTIPSPSYLLSDLSSGCVCPYPLLSSSLLCVLLEATAPGRLTPVNCASGSPRARRWPGSWRPLCWVRCPLDLWPWTRAEELGVTQVWLILETLLCMFTSTNKWQWESP